MLTMTEKTFLGLATTLSIVCAATVVLPAASSYEVSLVTSPNSEVFYIPAGVPFNITCRGLGDDPEKFSSLKWIHKNGQVISEGIPVTQEKEKNSLTLTFTDPQEIESGVYKCMAVYGKNQALQKSVSIIFHGSKPSFYETYQNVTAKENSYLEILCAAEGESPITYEWYDQNEEKIITNYNSSVYVSDVANASTLIIPRVTMGNEGVYTCSASNRHGLSTKIFELLVLTMNDTSGNDTTNGTASFRRATVIYVTATSVRFAFDVIGSVKSIEVRYRENHNSTEYFKEFRYGDVYEIKGLTPAGYYNFQFRAKPSSENDSWSQSYEVILLPEKPEVIFKTIDSATGTVKLEWLFNYDTRLLGTIDSHEITYFTVQMQGIESRWVPSKCNITVRIPECAPSSYTVTGLSQKVYYEIQVRARTASGYSEPYRQKISFW